MLFHRYSSLDWLLIELLATKRGASAQWLHKQVGLHHKTCSLQAIYKQLRNLQSQGIVVRLQKTFSLSLWWTLELIELTNTIELNYLKSISTSEIALNQGEKRKWQFSNLLRMDDFIMQLILFAHKTSGEKLMYQWIPHPWFYFAHHDKVRNYYRTYQKEKNIMKLVLGGNTFLDRLYVREQEANIAECVHIDSPFLGMKNRHLIVIDEYIISIEIDPAMYSQINSIFDETKSLAALSVKKVVALFDNKVRIQLKFERNRQEAAALIKNFESTIAKK